MYVLGGIGRTVCINTLVNIAVATSPSLYVRPLEHHELELVTSTCTMSCNVLLQGCTRHIRMPYDHPLHPHSLPLAVQWCLDHGANGGENSKDFFESCLLSFRFSTSTNGVPPSVVRLVKPVFEEAVGCVLSSRGRATLGASAEAAWAALLLFSRLV
jgi:hypothetical protein